MNDDGGARVYYKLTYKTSAQVSLRKQQMLQDRLTKKSVKFSPIEIKDQLYKKIKLHKTKPVYKTDRLAMEHGHYLLRTSVRHCGLNPTELIRANVKSFVGRNNTSFKLSDVKRLVHQASVRIDWFVWQNTERHVLDIEEQYRFLNAQ